MSISCQQSRHDSEKQWQRSHGTTVTLPAWLFVILAAARAVGGARAAAGAGRALVPAPQGEPRHPRDQHAAQRRAAAVQADAAPGADRPPVPRPEGAGGHRAASAARRGCPATSCAARVDRYAREIVPAFNAYLYFRVGYWLGKALAKLLYRVRLGYTDTRGAGGGQPEIDHRVRDEPPQQHGLRAGGVSRRRARGAVLRGGRVGADLAAAAADPLDGRLFRAAQLRRSALPHGARSATCRWRSRRACRRRCIPRAGCRWTAGCARPGSGCSTTC